MYYLCNSANVMKRSMIVIISLVIVGIAVLLLSIGILIKRDGKFPSGHVEDIEALRKKGIQCAHKELNEAAFRPNLKDLIEENK